MSENILIIRCGGEQSDPKVDYLLESLRKKGTEVEQIQLEGNHRSILDRLEHGACPLLIKGNL